jgi:hypothetical protein
MFIESSRLRFVEQTRSENLEYFLKKWFMNSSECCVENQVGNLSLRLGAAAEPIQLNGLFSWDKHSVTISGEATLSASRAPRDVWCAIPESSDMWLFVLVLMQF